MRATPQEQRVRTALYRPRSWQPDAEKVWFAQDSPGGGRWIRNVGPAPWRGQGRAALLDIRRGMRHGVRSGAAFDRAFPCSAGRYDRAYPFGGDGHPSTDKLVGASGVQRELRGQIIVRHIWATGELSNPRPSFGCLKCLPTMSSKSSMSTTMCGSKA